MIILEGPDGAGKSTIAERLSKEYNLPIKSGEGPPKSPQDFSERVDRYLSLPARYIYDRHPVISGPIYASLRGQKSGLTRVQSIDFYSRKKLVLVVIPSRPDLFEHKLKEYDTEQHVQMVNEQMDKLQRLYRALCKMPDHHRVDPLGSFLPINALVEDHLKGIENEP